MKPKPVTATAKRVKLLRDCASAKAGMKGTVLGEQRYPLSQLLVQFDEKFPGGHGGDDSGSGMYGRQGYCHWIPATTEYLMPLGFNDKEIPPRIAGYPVADITKEGFTIGCRTITWEEVEQLLALRPQDVPEELTSKREEKEHWQK